MWSARCRRRRSRTSARATSCSTAPGPPRLVGPQAHAAGDAVALDLAGAAGDRGHDRLPVAEAHDALSGEAVPRADLHAQPGGGNVGLRALELGHRAFPAARL